MNARNQSLFARLTLAVLVAISVGALACSSTPPAQADDVAPERPAPDFSEPPEAYSAVEVMGVVALPQGAAVMLGSIAQEVILPIFINAPQAMAIQLGLEDETFERPLTHDLVEDIMNQLDVRVGKIQVDELRDGTFYATIFLVTPTEILEIDSRPSDAIALAVKDEIPIYVADSVLRQAGLTDDDFPDLPPADPGDPDDFRDAPTTPL